jgi:hypothetical protein
MAKIGINLQKGKIDSQADHEVIIGIDLGTTNSLVAYIDHCSNAPICISNEGSKNLVPSVVHFGENGAIIIGDAAKKMLEINPSRTIFSAKRLMGKSYNDISHYTDFFSYNIIDDNTTGSPTPAKNPFAGQDVMNTLSLLITGIPYNYATFFKAARETDNYGRDPQTGQDSAYSYYKSLTSDLQKNNLLWGNFIPFKQLVMDEKSFNLVRFGSIFVS